MEDKKNNVVICPNCGIEQEYNPEFPYCKRCGLFLPESLLKKEPKDKGNNESLRGGAILLFLLFVLIFIFYSRFYATIGIVFTLILYILSFFIGKREAKSQEKNKASSTDKKD